MNEQQALRAIELDRHFIGDDEIGLQDGMRIYKSPRMKLSHPTVIRDLFSDEIKHFIRSYTAAQVKIKYGRPYDDHLFKRYCVHNASFFVDLHKGLVDRASEIFGEKVKKSYCLLSMYRDKGVCPLHTDRIQCVYTLDYCISQGEPWDIYVDDKPYQLQEGEALAFSGTASPHYRSPIKEGNFCNLVYFHFVPERLTCSLD